MPAISVIKAVIYSAGAFGSYATLSFPREVNLYLIPLSGFLAMIIGYVSFNNWWKNLEQEVKEDLTAGLRNTVTS